MPKSESGLGAWLSFYNEERQHQSRGYRTPGPAVAGERFLERLAEEGVI